MLLTPRTYALSQVPDAGCKQAKSSYFLVAPSRKERIAEERRARRMLLLHQTGSVKVGEVVRYTITYTPSEDRILPSPAFLHVKIRNSSAIPLRAAYLHGPYNIHVAAYPSTFNPNKKVEFPRRDGTPEFEPNLKAGGTWTARLTVPEHIREVGGQIPSHHGDSDESKSATWIIEIASQIIFSQSASVSYEMLVARDERSLDLGFTAITGNSHGSPGQVRDHQQGKRTHTANHTAQPKGVYSRAVKLVVEDTTSLWNKPELPEVAQDEASQDKSPNVEHPATVGEASKKKKKRIHLVMVTHGLHSNLGADMLYLKESIDATAKQAREDRRRRRREQSASKSASKKDQTDISTAPLSGGQDSISPQEDEDDEDEEEVVVRGFSGNVIRTERGIQYLGKRLAKYVLSQTYPDQPFLPIRRSISRKISGTFSPAKDRFDEGIPAHAGSSVQQQPAHHRPERAYRYTSISFIGHSLGGLVQTYAIAYIYKHSPHFFENIKPVNFVALATPFLGLSNENPMYVKFALDFGLVGRTGQDLGLTWRAPTLARSGWTAMVSGLGAHSHKDEDHNDPGAKPLLRILPTGPAHVVLRMFRNRTLYSNVVNDGIVPLRTSCLLFLDWRGIDKVEKARRENGLIGTVAGWGWGQLTGQNTSPNPSSSKVGASEEESGRVESPTFSGDDTAVPQPGADVTNEDDEAQAAAGPSAHQFLDAQKRDPEGQPLTSPTHQSALSTLWNYIRPSGKHTARDKKMFRRSQTLHLDQEGPSDVVESEPSSPQDGKHLRTRPPATRGDSLANDPHNVSGPPKTTIFESAGDLLSPPVPPTSWIIDPSTRARTIFHDRIYHPEDIPPPPSKKQKAGRSFSSENSSNSLQSETSGEEGGMRVEEKIARAYHKDLSWRKVLVRLEPDAHNNIVVRRMFANAYGWPVIKHLCDTHFADTYSAATRDENEPGTDRAKGVEVPVQEDGEHVKGQNSINPPVERTESELREVADELRPLKSPTRTHRLYTADSVRSKDSAQWDDSYFYGTSDDDDDDEHYYRNPLQRFLQPQSPQSPRSPVDENVLTLQVPPRRHGQGTSDAEIADFLSRPPPSLDVRRGLGPTPRKSSGSTAGSHEPDSLESVGGVIPTEPRQTTSPPDTPAGLVSDVGLRKAQEITSPPASVSSPSETGARSRSESVSEQVAKLTVAKDDKQDGGSV